MHRASGSEKDLLGAGRNKRSNTGRGQNNRKSN